MTGDDAHDEGFEREYETERTTAPQSEYTMADVGRGFLIAVVGLAVTFGVPLAVLGL